MATQTSNLVSLGAASVSNGDSAVVGFSSRRYVSVALGRAWMWVKNHPSWTPGVSTVTGICTAALYFSVAAVASVAIAGGILVSIGSSLIPSESLAKDVRLKTVIWVSAGDNFLATSLRLAVRGVVSALPVIGNGIIFGADLFNGKNQKEEYLFCLLDETKQTQNHSKGE